jgi:hypothetical protein
LSASRPTLSLNRRVQTHSVFDDNGLVLIASPVKGRRMDIRSAVVGSLVFLAVAANACGGCNGGDGRVDSGTGTIEPIATVTVMDSMARACEILLTIPPGPTPEADFGDGVKGAVQRRDDKLAVAFTATTDAPIRSPINLLRPTGTAMKRSVSVTGTCYDRSGRMLPGRSLEIR